jgi:hypothetical protein
VPDGGVGARSPKVSSLASAPRLYCRPPPSAFHRTSPMLSSCVGAAQTSPRGDTLAPPCCRRRAPTPSPRLPERVNFVPRRLNAFVDDKAPSSDAARLEPAVTDKLIEQGIADAEQPTRLADGRLAASELRSRAPRSDFDNPVLAMLMSRAPIRHAMKGARWSRIWSTEGGLSSANALWVIINFRREPKQTANV